MFIGKAYGRGFVTRRYSKNLKSLVINAKNDNPGELKSILQVFADNNLSLTSIKSFPASFLDSDEGNSFEIDFKISDGINNANLLNSLEKKGFFVKEIDPKQVLWFPTELHELDLIEKTTLSAGADLQSDHPGFHDKEYRDRRNEIAQIANLYKISHGEIPRVEYTTKEIETWKQIFDVLSPLHKQHACKEYNDSIEEMKSHCGFQRNNIPQLQDINDYLKRKTGYRLFPISGLLKSREFLSYLAFRLFPSTQYIRHHSVPFYTPEPDIVHELIGHAPMFANQDFADFSQQLGLASLGASDFDIKRLSTCYWFSVEFGLIKEENGDRKIYGAGTLSSVDEILNSVSKKSEIHFFDPFKVCEFSYPISTLQPFYFWSKNFEEGRQMMSKFANSIPKGFVTSYDKKNQRIRVHQNITMVN